MGGVTGSEPARDPDLGSDRAAQAIRKVIPALGNYLIAMFKDTPLLFAIGVAELLTEAQRVGSAGFRVVEAYTVVGILFLLVSIPSAILIRRLERRYAAV